jgi:hypothetical protein
LVKRSAIISLIALSGSAINDFRDGANMAAKFVLQTWTNLTTFWHQNEFKNIVWQKEGVENTWK